MKVGVNIVEIRVDTLCRFCYAPGILLELWLAARFHVLARLECAVVDLVTKKETLVGNSR